jgi:hypothetical protein
VQISASEDFTVAVASDGTAWSWGANDAGQLGNGTSNSSDTPVPVTMPAGVAFTAVATGSGGCCRGHVLALDSTGRLWGWGADPFNDNGTGSATNVPMPVTAVPAGVTFSAIGAGPDQSYAVASDGTLYAWGDNGDGATTVPTLPSGDSWTAVSGGWDYGIGLDSQGNAWGWGVDDGYQLGTGGNGPGEVVMPSGMQFQSVSASHLGDGNGFTLALDTTGHVWAWGYNGNGELGDGTTTSRSTPAPVDIPAGVTITAVAAGGSHSLALDSAGRVWAWGDNSSGQLGDGTTTSQLTPEAINKSSGATFAAISAGTLHSVAATFAEVPGPPIDVKVIPHNGSAKVSWQPPSTTGSSPITGYVVTATPTYNDRRPRPQAGSVSEAVDSSTLSVTIPGLAEDCHQVYVVSIAAQNAAGRGAAAASSPFRPSGIVIPGQDPPYVVILLDGINEAQPGFTMDPYHPTQGTPSYCPESFNRSTGKERESDFHTAPDGPWSFFHKWNFGEVDSSGDATGKNPDGTTPNTESAPRAFPGNPQGIAAGTHTHSFMLDAIAAQGAIILPFSYKGVTISGHTFHTFTFAKYNKCDSTPQPFIVCFGDRTANTLDWARELNTEVNHAAEFWPTSEIVVMGHSQGGLIAFTWWLCSQIIGGYCHNLHTHLPQNFLQGFSLDSPINGACALGACVGPPSYPPYQFRQAYDPLYLRVEARASNSFRFAGTYGDSPAGGYQSNAETLQHQMLFPYSHTMTSDAVNDLCSNPFDESRCPAPAPPDHISTCPVKLGLVSLIPDWATAHYVVKYCPDDVAYFNNTLGLNY